MGSELGPRHARSASRSSLEQLPIFHPEPGLNLRPERKISRRGNHRLTVGQAAQESLRSDLVQLRENIVQEQNGWAPDPFFHQLVAGQAQSQSERPLLALRRVGAGRQTADPQVHIVPVRSDRGNPPPKVGPSRAL